MKHDRRALSLHDVSPVHSTSVALEKYAGFYDSYTKYKVPW